MPVMNYYDVGIIGAGVAGAFASLRISEKYPQIKTILFDLGRPPGKRRRQLEGWLGCFPSGDGKIYLNNKTQLENSNLFRLEQIESIYTWVLNSLEQCSNIKITKDNLPSAELIEKITNHNFEIHTNDYVQWKPEQVHKLSKIISDKIKLNKNLDFSFDNEVLEIKKLDNEFLVETTQGKFLCKKILLCVGRSGWRWVSSLYKTLGLTYNDDLAQFGIRVEIASHHLKELNNSHCNLQRNDLEIGPFFWNGTVIPEDHADLVIASFRSNEERWKSEKVSFSVLFNQIFENQGVSQTERVGKLIFLLSNDRVTKERIKILFKKNNLSFLSEYHWIPKILLELEEIFPNIITKGYFHVPELIPMACKINLRSNLETEIDGLFVAGESARLKGIFGAALSGSLAIDGMCV